MPISPETEDLCRETWSSGIPLQYRYTDQTLVDRRILSSIILPPPPKSVLDRFWAHYFLTDQNAFLITHVEAERGCKRVRLIL
jgi:hypothetical protein